MTQTSHLPARQVHLDFHTSEHIRGIGAKFNRAQFQKALKAGHVNSVTLFAKCHHSLCYYPTDVGIRHPHLKFDLLGEQIAACHEMGVRAPIYITVGWSHIDQIRHPEWSARDKAGRLCGFGLNPDAEPTDKRPEFGWYFLCPSGGYRQHILDLTEEICQRYPVDGLFYDICMYQIPICHCANCVQGMKDAGLDPDHESDARDYSVKKWASLSAECAAIKEKHHPGATLFFNGQSNNDAPLELFEHYTHFELEDLPTTWGGYNIFPPRAKVFHRHGKDLLAMSGKFHTAWGEFGGFKHPTALKYEVASMVAFGARCSIGDQLHPDGQMDMETYRNLGEAYSYVRRIEEYGYGGQPFSNLGVMLSHDSHATDQGFANSTNNQGVFNMLMEEQIDYEIAEPGGDLSRFDTIILTGGRILNRATVGSLRAFIERGGKLLVLGQSLLDRDTGKVILDAGVRLVGAARYDNDYLKVGGALSKNMVRSPFLNYMPAPRYRPTKAEVLAEIFEPYFPRTYGTFCSHQNTPYRPMPAPHGGAFRFGNVIFLPHALGAIYQANGARLHRDFFINALRLLHRRPVLEVGGLPSEGRVNLWHQADKRRYVVHLLYAAPIQRGRCSIIEDIVELRDITVALRVPEKIQKVRLPLEKASRPFKKSKGAVSVTIPRVHMHQIAVFEYGADRG
ncbi:hypothetical protein QQ056_17750 [Oscillatoria laete-virens NRMC-F 0139]|nr:hypothetical protein [Oscillatoria laete-virens]MDL5055378.1 hypothetical protein [Oscillatoria laete-virens NRMC-F 0139]